MNAVLKTRFERQYRGQPAERLLDAPVHVLRGITSRQAAQLADLYQIYSVAGFLDAWPLAAGSSIRIDPSIIHRLRCILFYPKYDPGPPCSWEQVFEQAPLGDYVGHGSGRFRTRFGPVFYRGRLDGSARALIVAQDPSTDEVIAQRNLVGSAGQRLQRLLNKLGLTRSYVMLNTFLFGITGQFDATMEGIALEAPVLNYRNQLFDKVAAENAIEAVLAFGNAAQFGVQHWPGSAAYTVIELHHPSAPDAVVLPNWNGRLAAASAAIAADPGGVVDLTNYGAAFTAADSVAIPRYDLPFGIPSWHGAGGTRSNRNGPGVIEWNAP